MIEKFSTASLVSGSGTLGSLSMSRRRERILSTCSERPEGPEGV